MFPLVVNRWVQLDVGCRDSLPLKAVLSFAVGGLLGDVFLHLMPEAWGSTSGDQSLGQGLWVLAGFFSFLLVEKAVMCTEVLETDSRCSQTLKVPTTNGVSYMNGSSSTGEALHTSVDQHISVDKRLNKQWVDKDIISGYLNLVANCTDNFTHGLAIAASYVASPAVGLLTTLAILCHEIPHEIGDFAILLNSGFSCEGAAKAQLVTACGGGAGGVGWADCRTHQQLNKLAASLHCRRIPVHCTGVNCTWSSGGLLSVSFHCATIGSGVRGGSDGPCDHCREEKLRTHASSLNHS